MVVVAERGFNGSASLSLFLRLWHCGWQPQVVRQRETRHGHMRLAAGRHRARVRVMPATETRVVASTLRPPAPLPLPPRLTLVGQMLSVRGASARTFVCLCVCVACVSRSVQVREQPSESRLSVCRKAWVRVPISKNLRFSFHINVCVKKMWRSAPRGWAC